MKTSAFSVKKSWLALLLLLITALPLTGCGASPEKIALAAGPQAVPVEPANAISVRTATVQSGSIATVYNYTGNLQAVNAITVLPMVSGRVQSVLVEAGDQVKAGDPIAVLENKAYAAQLKQAKAQLEVVKLNLQKMEDGARPEQLEAAQEAVQIAKSALTDVYTINDDERTAAVAQLAAAEAQLKLAQYQYDKISWAGQTSMTPQALQLEQATIAYDTAKAAYDLRINPGDAQTAALKAQLTQAELQLKLAQNPTTETEQAIVHKQVELATAAVELAQVQVDESVIRAPFDGTIAEIYIDKGAMVAPTVPVGKLVSDNIEMVFKVEESRLPEVKIGQNAALQVSAYEDVDFPAVVTNIAPIADAHSHTFAVTVTPQDTEHRLHSGMYAKLALLVDERSDALLVPQSAVAKNAQGESVVYVVNSQNQIETRPVTIGLAQNDQVEILSGVAKGEAVVTVGLSQLTDGANVTVMQ